MRIDARPRLGSRAHSLILLALFSLPLLISPGPADAQSFASFIPPRAKDSSGGQYLRLLSGDDYTADRSLTFTLGDADRTLTLSGNSSLNQSLLTTATPTFAGNIHSTGANVPYLQLRGSDYGTTYTGNGTMDQWIIASNNGTQAVTWPRLDRVYFEGYNLDPNGQGQTRLRTDEPGFFRRYETIWVWAGDQNEGGAWTPSALTLSGSDTIVDSDISRFATGSALVGEWLRFSTSGNSYLVKSWQSNTRVTVEGNATAETGQARLYIRSMEYHMGPIWLDGTALRSEGYLINIRTKYVNLGWTGDVFTFANNNQGGTQNNLLTLRNADGMTLDSNNLFLRGRTTANVRRALAGIDGTDTIQIGDSALPLNINGSSVSFPSSTLSLTTISGLTTVTGGPLQLPANINLGASASTATSIGCAVGSSSTVTTGINWSETYTGSSTGAVVAYMPTLTHQGTGNAIINRGLVGSFNIDADPSTSSRCTGIQMQYGKTSSRAITQGTHFWIGQYLIPNSNTTSSNHSGGTIHQTGLYVAAPTWNSTGGTYNFTAAILGGDVLMASGKKIILEGAIGSPAITTPTMPTIGDSYLNFNATGGAGSAGSVETYVNGTNTSYQDSTGIVLPTAGLGLAIKEGTNAKMGTATLNGTTAVTVWTTAVTANSRIFLTIQTPGGTPASPYVHTRSAGTSFNVKSTGASDTSTIAWMIVEPAP